MKILLSGLWARRGLNCAVLAMSMIALVAATLGPMYARESAEHLLDVRLTEQPPYATGLTDSLPAVSPVASSSYNKRRPDGTIVPLSGAELISNARGYLSHTVVGHQFRPVHPWLYDNGGVLHFAAKKFTVPLYWRRGMCALATVHGTCPTGPGEVLMQQTMATTMGLGVGDPVTLAYQVGKVRRVDNQFGTRSLQEFDHTVSRTFRLVGTYKIPHPGSPAWFDSSRFTGTDNLAPVPPGLGSSATSLPVAPALLVSPKAMTSQSYIGGGDRPIDPRGVDLDNMQQALGSMVSFRQRVVNSTGTDPLGDVQLSSIIAQVRSEHTLLSRVMIAALAPLVVLALLLLYALVAAAAEVRRPYVALAKLRGHRRDQVFRFAVSEAFLMVLVAVPVALGLAFGLAHLVARLRLSAQTPVAFDRAAIASLVLVAAAALLASAFAAMAVIREPLASSLGGAVRPRTGSRGGLVLRSAVLAVAVAAVAQLLTSKHQSGQLLALLTPLLVALAVAVVGLLLVRLFGVALVRRTASGGATARYLATRRLARRGDLLNLMVPMLLAVSVIGFALSATSASDSWRLSRASAEVGAGKTFNADVDPGRLLSITREVDPKGRYLAAAVFDNAGDGLDKHVFVDASRLAAVTTWDPSWSAKSVAALQRALAPRWHRPTFSGEWITVRMSRIHLKSPTDRSMELWLRYVNDQGEVSNTEIGRLRQGRRDTVSAGLFDCQGTCQLGQLTFTGSGQSVSDVNGTITIDSVSVGGRLVDWGLDSPGGWRAARPYPVSMVDAPVTLDASPSGLRLHLYLGKLPGNPVSAPVSMVSGVASIAPSVVPEVVPVLLTGGLAAPGIAKNGSGLAVPFPDRVRAGSSLSGVPMPVRVVGRVAALPQLGRVGELGDLDTQLIEYAPPQGALVNTQLWVARGAPASVVDAVRAKGVGLTPNGDFAQTLRDLHNDAFARGLQVFLGVGLATLLLAVFGLFAFAVMSSRWRGYEVASLRVVGVSQKTLVLASIWEYLTMLGLAVVLGVGSAILSLTLVLPAISLGPSSPVDPPPAYAVAWAMVLGSGAVVLVLAVAVALVVSSRVTRLGRPSTLRWAEQG